MSYANHPARPSTPPGGRSSLTKFTSESANRSYSHLTKLYVDSPFIGKSKRGSLSGGPGSASKPAHPFPTHAKSLKDLKAFERLLEGQAGAWEHCRKDEEELKAIGRMKNGSQLVAYYERQNSILDGWKEVDQVLGSHFPYEVMMRFGTEAEIAEMTARRKATRKRRRRGSSAEPHRLPAVHPSQGHDDSAANSDDGYEEDNESDDDELDELREPIQPKPRAGLARAASALSGLWFGRSSSGTRARDRDIEREGLLSTSSSIAASPDLEAQRGRSTFPARRAASQQQPYSAEGTADYGSTNTAVNSASGAGPSVILADDRPVAVVNEANSQDEGSLDRRVRDERERIRQREVQKGLRDPSESDSRGPGQAESSSAANGNGHGDGTKVAASAEGAAGGQNGAAAAQQKKKRDPSKQRATDGQRERDRNRLLASVPGLAEKEDEADRAVQFAININLAINVLLLAGKGIAVLSSNSVSLLASLVDSALDLLSTLIIFATSKAIAYRSFHTMSKYPIGKKRFEPLGVVIFSVLMIASFCQVLVESCQRLAGIVRTGGHGAEDDDGASLPLIGIIFMVATIGIKAVMWLLYRTSRSSGVRAVAQDAENDVVFNVASLIFPVVGSFLKAPALDPIGGIALSLYIIFEWLQTLAETVTKLSGRVCGSHDIARVLYLILRFKAVRSVSAMEMYHAGDDKIVECDVVLPSNINLKEAHDVAELITYCTELLPDVERVYVHLDYNERGPSGHMTLRG